MVIKNGDPLGGGEDEDLTPSVIIAMRGGSPYTHVSLGYSEAVETVVPGGAEFGPEYDVDEAGKALLKRPDSTEMIGDVILRL